MKRIIDVEVEDIHYIEFLFPGVFLDETSNEQIVKDRKDEFVTMPPGAFAYRFFDRTIAKIDGEVLVGEKRNVSLYTYLGKEYTLEQVKEVFPNSYIMDKLEGSNKCRAVRTIVGTWVFINPNDRLITVKY